MTLQAISLQSLKPEYVSQLYKRAEADEAIFRNILVNLSDDSKEADFFKTTTLDNIFERYVRVSGYETRVSDFRVGPFESDDIPGYYPGFKFPEFDPKQLPKDQALIFIEKSNDTWLKLYQILENSSVKFIKSENFHLL